MVYYLQIWPMLSVTFDAKTFNQYFNHKPADDKQQKTGQFKIYCDSNKKIN